MFVSVVIPTYNRKPILEKCLTALEQQQLGGELERYEVVVVDDGIATGATMRVALMAVRDQAPRSVTVAVPVGAPEAEAEFARLADHVICLLRPQPFFGVGQGYEDFGQTSDDEVVALLQGQGGAGKPEPDTT